MFSGGLLILPLTNPLFVFYAKSHKRSMALSVVIFSIQQLRNEHESWLIWVVEEEKMIQIVKVIGRIGIVSFFGHKF